MRHFSRRIPLDHPRKTWRNPFTLWCHSISHISARIHVNLTHKGKYHGLLWFQSSIWKNYKSTRSSSPKSYGQYQKAIETRSYPIGSIMGLVYLQNIWLCKFYGSNAGKYIHPMDPLCIVFFWRMDYLTPKKVIIGAFRTLQLTRHNWQQHVIPTGNSNFGMFAKLPKKHKNKTSVRAFWVEKKRGYTHKYIYI